MADLVGLSAREALRRVARLGVTAKIQGTGLVVAQYPEAGQTLAIGGACTLMLDRGAGRSSRASSGPLP